MFNRSNILVALVAAILWAGPAFAQEQYAAPSFTTEALTVATTLDHAQCRPGHWLTNEGATALRIHTLPVCDADHIGMQCNFMVTDADGITVDPGDATDRIWIETNAAGDSIDSPTAENAGAISLRCVNANDWIPNNPLGTWADGN
jgi:hypothetical protein